MIYPQNDRLATFLDSRFRTWEEQASHPRFLDKAVAQTPELAVNALVLELSSIAERIRTLYSQSVPIKKLNPNEFEGEQTVIKTLSSKASQFIVNVESAALSEKTTEALATLLRIEQYFLTCAFSLDALSKKLEAREPLKKAGLEKHISVFLGQVGEFMGKRNKIEELEANGSIQQQLATLSASHDATKAELIICATRSEISVSQMSQAIDCLAEALQIAQQWAKGLSRLHTLSSDIQIYKQ